MRAPGAVRLELSGSCHVAPPHGQRFGTGTPALEDVADDFVFEDAYRVAGTGLRPPFESGWRDDTPDVSPLLEQSSIGVSARVPHSAHEP